MKNFLCLAMFLLSILPLQNVCSQKQNALRILCYNIRNSKGLDNITDYQRTADVINRVAPDVVALQEVDSVTGRSAHTDVLRELAERTLMHRTFAPAINYDGGKYGIGVLSKEKPLSYYFVALPGREEARVLLIVEFRDYVFCCTHFSLTPEDQLASIPVLQKEFQKIKKPVFLAGDLNAENGSELITELQKEFDILNDPKQNTFPADNPDKCIDYILAYKKNAVPYTLLSRRVISEPKASDHRPVTADIRFKASKDAIFRTAPYLQNPVGDGITVMWNTRVPAHSWVEYGTDKNNLTQKQTIVAGQIISNNYLNQIRLDNLIPGQTYYYRVCSREITQYQAYHKEFGETVMSDFSSFTLPAANEQNFTAFIFNDVHKQNATLNKLYEQVKDIPYNFVVFNGDVIDDPDTEDTAIDCLSSLNQIIKANQFPVFNIRGNHEIRNAFSMGLSKLFDYPGGKTYGAFSWGDTRIVLLDCGEDKPDDHWVYYGLNDFDGLRKEQVAFLKNEITSREFKKASKRVLIHHIPIYGEVEKYNPCRELWHSVLAKAPFNVSINGHTHRFSYHPKGKDQNNFPIVIGGGYKPDDATVMVLQKQGKELTVKVINVKGETILDLVL